MQVSLTKRDFSAPQLASGIRWEVERLEWRAVGGPQVARLRARAGRGQPGFTLLWELARLLRCGVTVSDELGPAWWGYLETVEIHWGARVARVSLDGMWNRIMVEYREYSPASQEGVRMLTGISSDAGSIREYGYKERVFRARQQMTGAQAAAYAATLLGQHCLPAQSVDVSGADGEGEPSALVTCRGWWETLNWRFYSDSRGMLGNPIGGTRWGLGSVASVAKWAQSFTCGAEGWTVSEVWIKPVKVGVPADSLRVDLCRSTNNLPGTSLASGSLPGWGIATDIEWRKFSLGAGMTLSANTPYWLQLSRSGAVDASNYYMFACDGQSQWAGGVLRVWNGSAWGAWPAAEGDMVFMLVGYADNGERMARILDSSAGCGQFLTGIRQEAVGADGLVGISSLMFRDGSTRGREELEELLLTGTPAGARLLATVDSQRVARIFPQPDPASARLVVGMNGELVRMEGGRLAVSEWPAGQWARLGEMERTVFVEGCAWEGGRMAVRRFGN